MQGVRRRFPIEKIRGEHTRADLKGQQISFLFFSFNYRDRHTSNVQKNSTDTIEYEDTQTIAQ